MGSRLDGCSMNHSVITDEENLDRIDRQGMATYRLWWLYGRRASAHVAVVAVQVTCVSTRHRLWWSYRRRASAHVIACSGHTGASIHVVAVAVSRVTNVSTHRICGDCSGDDGQRRL